VKAPLDDGANSSIGEGATITVKRVTNKGL